MGLDMTSFDFALKEHYTNDRVLNMVYADNPLLALMPKYENFGGELLRIPVIYANPQGRSADFSRAQARSLLSSTAGKKFNLTRVKDYAVAVVDNETLEASMGNENALMEAAITEIDGAINSLTRSVAVAMYRDGYGSIGSIATSSMGTTTLTLNNIDDITNFEVGQELVVATGSGSGALKTLGSSGNGLLVTGVDRTLGTLSFAYNVNDSTNGIPTIAQNDYLFVRGDRASGASPALTKIAGLAAWVPASAPSATSFFGVDRTSDVTRLSGLRLTATALPIEEALIQGAALVAREGHKLDYYFMNYTKYAELEKSLGSKVQYVDLKVTADVSFRGIMVNGPRGPIKVVPDQNSPAGTVFGVTMDYWKLYSIKKPVRIFDTDGVTLLRQSSADGVEVRCVFYGNVGCRGPGGNINITVNA